mgnify:CR=1 FL=1
MIMLIILKQWIGLWMVELMMSVLGFIGREMYRYDFVGLLMHAEHLEAAKGVGPHTISVPRICPADDIDKSDFSKLSAIKFLKRL